MNLVPKYNAKSFSYILVQKTIKSMQSSIKITYMTTNKVKKRRAKSKEASCNLKYLLIIMHIESRTIC